ncbi:hypothetical protein XENOCAPTIV_012376 [Xenoophorus captivus]|uniref:Uncharacterized protein n=1 Tax=Xenoophorus captivus TaxID=1517983 RepID=A0ABV0S3L6_9TELE
MGERRARSFHMTCHVQRDYGSRMRSSFIRCSPNGCASSSISLSLDQEMDLAASTGSTTGCGALPVPASDIGHYSPVSLELDPLAVNNRSGFPCLPPADTKDPDLQIAHSQLSD